MDCFIANSFVNKIKSKRLKGHPKGLAVLEMRFVSLLHFDFDNTLSDDA